MISVVVVIDNYTNEYISDDEWGRLLQSSFQVLRDIGNIRFSGKRFESDAMDLWRQHCWIIDSPLTSRKVKKCLSPLQERYKDHVFISIGKSIQGDQHA